MPTQRQKSSSQSNLSKVSEEIGPAPGPTFFSLPIEIRLLIYTACIEPSQYMDCNPEEFSHLKPPSWFLSHTINPSLLLVSKQIRQEACSAIAAQSDLAVVCNVRTFGRVTPSYIAERRGRTETLQPNPSFRALSHDALTGDSGREKKQRMDLIAPNRFRLILKLYADGYGTEYNLVDGLEDVERSRADAAFRAIGAWTQWQHVIMDLPGMDGSMGLRASSRWGGVPRFELDQYLASGWRAMPSASNFKKFGTFPRK